MDGTGWIGQVSLLAQLGGKFRIFWATLGLVTALIVFAIIVAITQRWRKRSPTEGLTAGDQLSHFRELRDRGEITAEEFERIRAQLAGDLRKEMNLGPAPVREQATAPPAGGSGPSELTLPQPPSENIRPE